MAGGYHATGIVILGAWPTSPCGSGILQHQQTRKLWLARYNVCSRQ